MIKIGNNDAVSVKVGNTDITEGRVGNNLVWPVGPPATLSFLAVVYSSNIGYLHANADSNSGQCFFIVEYSYTGYLNGSPVIITKTDSATPIAFSEFIVNGHDLKYNKAKESAGGYGNVPTSYGYRNVTLAYSGLTTTGAFLFGGNTSSPRYRGNQITLVVGTQGSPVAASGGTISYVGGGYSQDNVWTSGAIDENVGSGSIIFNSGTGATNSSGFTAYIEDYPKQIFVPSLDKTEMGQDSYHFVSTSPSLVSQITLDVYQGGNTRTTISETYDPYEATSGNKIVSQYNVGESSGSFRFYVGKTADYKWTSGAEDRVTGEPISNQNLTAAHSDTSNVFVTNINKVGGENFEVYYNTNSSAVTRHETIFVTRNGEVNPFTGFELIQSASTQTYHYTLSLRGITYSNGNSLSPTGTDYCTFICYYRKYDQSEQLIGTDIVTGIPSSTYFTTYDTYKLKYNVANYGTTTVTGNQTATLSYNGITASTTFNFDGNFVQSTSYETTGVTVSGAGSSSSSPIGASGATITYTGGTYKTIKTWKSGAIEEGSSQKINFKTATNSNSNSFIGYCYSYNNQIIIPTLSSTTLSAGYYEFVSDTPLTDSSNEVKFKVYQAANTSTETSSSEVHKIYPSPEEIVPSQGYTASTAGGELIFRNVVNTITRYSSGVQSSSSSYSTLTGSTTGITTAMGTLFISNCYISSDGRIDVYYNPKSGSYQTNLNIITITGGDSGGGFAIQLWQ